MFDDSPSPSPFFSQPRPDVHYMHSSTRLSIGAKRNALCERSRGDLISFFDDDDLYASRYLTTMRARLGLAELAKLSVWRAYCERDGSLWEWDTHCSSGPCWLVSGAEAPVYCPSSDSDARFIHATSNGYGFSYVFKRSLFERCRFADMNMGEDYEWYCRAKPTTVLVRDCAHLVRHTMHSKGTSQVFPQRRIA